MSPLNPLSVAPWRRPVQLTLHVSKVPVWKGKASAHGSTTAHRFAQPFEVHSPQLRRLYRTMMEKTGIPESRPSRGPLSH